jgi:hypothetical protein
MLTERADSVQVAGQRVRKKLASGSSEERSRFCRNANYLMIVLHFILFRAGV